MRGRVEQLGAAVRRARALAACVALLGALLLPWLPGIAAAIAAAPLATARGGVRALLSGRLERTRARLGATAGLGVAYFVVLQACGPAASRRDLALPHQPRRSLATQNLALTSPPPRRHSRRSTSQEPSATRTPRARGLLTARSPTLRASPSTT